MVSETMRAMVVSEFGRQPELIVLLRPKPMGDEILLRVKAAGVCHTDMKIREVATARYRHDSVHVSRLTGHVNWK